MIHFLKKRRKFVSIVLLLNFLLQIIEPPIAHALTGGPTQPEVQSFQPVGASEMIDLFSGDFSYNIPLFELPGPNGGYPFNLSYQAGIGMDQESSWTGLGFNLNPGTMVRQMRGLPDEFKGDQIFTKMSIDPSVTVGSSAGVTLEVFGGEKNSSGSTSGTSSSGNNNSGAPSLNVGVGVYFNNYKGIGYSADGSIGYSKTISGYTTGVNLGVSLDSKEGIGVNPSLNLGGKTGLYGLGVGYNSKVGLSNISFSHDYVIDGADYCITNRKSGESESRTRKLTVSSNSSQLSLAHPGYTPQVTMPMRSVGITATFKAGGGLWGIFAAPYITGFYNEQWLKRDKERFPTGAYGYLNYQDASSSALLDITREKDGLVSSESPNLAIPSMSYDIYSVTGQGIAAMYRPMRNDYGIVHDQEITSISRGGSAGVDVGPPGHLGVNLSVNHARSSSGPWTTGNQIASKAAFQKKSVGDAYEPWYFKAHGEPTAESTEVMNSLGGDNAVQVHLNRTYLTPSATTTLKNRHHNQTMPSSAEVNRERKSRTQVIQTVTNGELLNNGQEEILSHFKIKYFDANGAEQTYIRSWPAHHIAGFTALTPEGLRYNYALPAYNLHQEEVTFTARKQSEQISRVNVGNEGGEDPFYAYPNTEKFLKRVEIPPYAHSHLLTSIIGPDYVDVTGDGVSEDDLGYWVKFTYKKTTTSSSPYKWRDPYAQAHYQEGWVTDPRDDKGTFVYGEKEIWYLAKAETKSHIASFVLKSRDDGKGVKFKLQDASKIGEAGVFALDEIRLFSRFVGSNTPIKIVKFEYDYSLCPGIYNNVRNGGKLTLKKVWFEYGASQRGRLNPYVFSYHTHNPSYDILSHDRWGTYKRYPDNEPYHNHDFPYSEQDPLKKEDIDNNAAAWSLQTIQLPSGGKIIVDYESDDYAYVQHKQAMQMTEIVNPYVDATQASGTSEFELSYSNAKVRFKLESPISDSLSTQDQKDEVLKYLDRERKQLYFKLKINLRSPSENFYEFISGYADINFDEPMGLEKDASGNYRYGYFYLVKEDGSHPFSMRAWQHVRTNQPELANSGVKLKQTNNTQERIKQIKSLGSIVAYVRQMFGGYYNFCKNENWGKEIMSGKSWIRLNSPDKVKYGGGLRVKQITIKDQWRENEEGIYGQVYKYTTEEDGRTISSGVAAYEPLAGGDENPLRYAKKYTQEIPLRSDNNLFFEYPINETYYPGPQVGYSKVTVMSLASAYAAGEPVKNISLSNGKRLFPEGTDVSYGTSGMTIHEFFTAKEFPVMTDETEKENRPYKLALLIPFLGNISISKLSASQGYSIVTNDMHGKPKVVSNFRQDKNGKLESKPISWIKYNYLCGQKAYEGKVVFHLLNTFKDNGDGTLSLASTADIENPAIPTFTLGQENEFFIDMRQFDESGWTGGVRLNVDLVTLALATVPWPNIGKTQNQLKTAVTNKIIFKSGIVQSIEAFDGGSLVKTENLKWDKLTGATVLSLVNNNFDAPVYSYTIPAYAKYQGMGAAYQNIGLTFSITNIQRDPYKHTSYTFSSSEVSSLFPGDEILLYETEEMVNPVAKVIYTGVEQGEQILYSDVQLVSANYTGMIVRSGYRNQLTVSAGSITALKDPSVQGTPVVYSKTITIPNE